AAGGWRGGGGPVAGHAHGIRADPESGGHVRRVRCRGAGPRAGAVCEPAHAVRAATGGGAAVPSRHPVGTNGVDPVALVRRPRDRGARTLGRQTSQGSSGPTSAVSSGTHLSCGTIAPRCLT